MCHKNKLHLCLIYCPEPITLIYNFDLVKQEIRECFNHEYGLYLTNKFPMKKYSQVITLKVYIFYQIKFQCMIIGMYIEGFFE